MTQAKMILFVLVLGFCLVCASCVEDTAANGSGIDDLEISASQCQDGDDNDGDGATDCADTDCMGFVFCVDSGCACDGSVCSACCNDGDGTCDEDGGVHDECIQGDYRIENFVDGYVIRNFSCITGSLAIDAPGLITLDLPNLESIGGNLQFTTDSNDDLQTVDVSSLKTVGLNLSIVDNMVLQNIDGLKSLETVGGNLHIALNLNLHSIDGLSSLQTVGGDVIITGNLSLTCNVAALDAQIDVAGSTTIQDNGMCDACGPSDCP